MSALIPYSQINNKQISYDEFIYILKTTEFQGVN